MDHTVVSLPYRASSLRNGDIPWKAGYHPGIDLVCTTDPTVLSISAGIVIKSQQYGAWGNYVVVRQSNGWSVIYAHLASRAVKVGEVVEPGTALGIMGATGQVDGAHLHLEIQTNYYDAMSTVDIAKVLQIVNDKGRARYI